MDTRVARAGAWAGWISLIGIFGYHLGLQALAGQRVSGTIDTTAIGAYYRTEAIALLSIEQFFTLIAVAVFVVALRQTLAPGSWIAFLGSVALLAVTVEAAVLVSEVALQAALVTTARAGGDVLPLFRFWDVLYNSGAYVLEATWVAAFGLAMGADGRFPRWLPRFSLVTAALLAINVTAIWVGIPDAATLPSALFLGIWFGGASFGLGRLARARSVAPTPAAQATTPARA